MIPTHIVIHASAGDDLAGYDWPGIRAYHLSLGWRDIGYHGGVERVGDAYVLQVGRMWDDIGAHTIGENGRSLGFCFIGNFATTPPPRAMLETASTMLRYWQRLFHIDAARVQPHKFFNATSCPGAAFDMAALREYLEA